MKYCSHCGNEVIQRVPAGDNLPRHVCDACDTIHYQNPNIVTGCIPVWGDRILLCRRAIEPRYGLWTLPAGFMENDETTAEGAAREAMEEANARLSDLALYGLFNLPHINQVYTMFRGILVDGQAHPGSESLETRLFAEDEIPWEELAFPVIRETLELFFEDRRAGAFPVHMGDIIRHPDHTVTIKRY
jgi:ADP-ribose pyrophosphatase YjhB (NUDIX family)